MEQGRKSCTSWWNWDEGEERQQSGFAEMENSPFQTPIACSKRFSFIELQSWKGTCKRCSVKLLWFPPPAQIPAPEKVVLRDGCSSRELLPWVRMPWFATFGSEKPIWTGEQNLPLKFPSPGTVRGLCLHTMWFQWARTTHLLSYWFHKIYTAC